MKKLLVFPLLLLNFQAFACGDYTTPLPKWRVGIIAAGHYSSLFYGFRPSFLPGVQVNRQFGKYELRLAVEHTQMTTEGSGMPNYMWGKGHSSRTLVRAGIERSIPLTRWLAVYGAADLAAQFGNSKVDAMGCFGPMGVITSRSRGAGIIPAVGVRFKMGPRISCFAEYRAEFFINDVRQKTKFGGNTESRPVNYTETDFEFGKIGHVGIQIAF
ncbi:MAG TPA: hypothetical protein VK826_16815 [Bacteroidia bacterium]|nr:hypothetical protein [Bacteroidia bacterium]